MKQDEPMSIEYQVPGPGEGGKQNRNATNETGHDTPQTGWVGGCEKLCASATRLRTGSTLEEVKE